MNRNTPTLVPSLKARQIELGSYQTFIIDLSSNVWACGSDLCAMIMVTVN